MPVGAPPSLLPFFEQAQQMFPGADKFTQYEIANRLKTQQWQQQQQGIQDMRDQANQQWVAQQQGPAQTFPGMPTGSGTGLFQPSPTGPFRDNSFNGVTNRPVGGYGQASAAPANPSWAGARPDPSYARPPGSFASRWVLPDGTTKMAW